MEQKITFSDTKGNKIAGILSSPTASKERTAIICHGFASSKDRPSSVAVGKVLESLNISTLRIDFFGHGESEGKFEDITISKAVDDILSAISFLEKKGYKKIALLGSSFGGISSLMAASKTSRLSLLILKSPVSDYEETEKQIIGARAISDWKKKGYMMYETYYGKKLRLNYTFFEDFSNNNAYAAAKKIGIPTLIVHGDKDEIVPISQSQKTSKIIKNCTLHILEGADHVYTEPKHSEEMLSAIKGFLQERFQK